MIPFPFNCYLGGLLSAAITTSLAVPMWRKWCQRHELTDSPGHRKIHAGSIPLAGGLSVFTGLLVPVLLAVLVSRIHSGAATIISPIIGPGALDSLRYGLNRRCLQLIGILIGALTTLLLGLWDDKQELPPIIKLGGQLIVALIVAFAGIRITLFIPNLLFSYAITVLWILTVINAMNFMDNMNGLCAGLGAIGAILCGLISAGSGQYLVATTTFIVAGALMGFLPHNFPKATVFLGDSGSQLVGYLLAVIAILPHFYTRQHPRMLLVLAPLFVLAVPLADLVSVVWIRWRLGKPFYLGDTNHLSHRLVRRGVSPLKAVLWIWTLALGFGLVPLLLWN